MGVCNSLYIVDDIFLIFFLSDLMTGERQRVNHEIVQSRAIPKTEF